MKTSPQLAEEVIKQISLGIPKIRVAKNKKLHRNTISKIVTHPEKYLVLDRVD